MKSQKVFYWAITLFSAGLMLLSAIPDVISNPGAVRIFAHLGYPAYLLPFLGLAKISGSVTILVPRKFRLKDWAYAGLTFDTIGAAYSHFKSGDGVAIWVFAIIALALILSSYYLYLRSNQQSLKPS